MTNTCSGVQTTMTTSYDSDRGDRRWPSRRPNKKFTVVRRYGAGIGGGGCGERPDAAETMTAVSPPPRHCEQQPSSRRTADFFETCETVEWKTMSKHFDRLPPPPPPTQTPSSFVSDRDNFQNGYPQQTSNVPQNHHLHYYSDLHKLHQVAYATRNTTVRKQLPPAVQQHCCKPSSWQWGGRGGGSHGRPGGTFMNSYYLSDPGMYAKHAEKVVQDDSLINLDEADQLSASVWRRYLDNRQSKAVYDTKMSMWCRLSEMIKNRTPGCGLYMVGSTMNGFGVDVSDADFCLLISCTSSMAAGGGYHQPDMTDERLCGVERLQWLMRLLEHERLIGNIRTTDTHIVYAKVPILRFRWTNDKGGSKMDVDLCCNNVVGIRNTHLLYCYSRLDYRVRPLVLTIKLWASCHNINDPKKMTLSSYSLVLMVINFLQSIRPPVLPSLQRIYGMKFSVDTNIEFIHMHEQLPSSSWRSDNKQSLGELLLQFFNYYDEFNYCKYAVSVRMGSPILLERCRRAETIKNDPGQWKFIGIEEPFERTNTARSVHNHNVFAQIKEVISKTHSILKETMSLDSIFHRFEH